MAEIENRDSFAIGTSTPDIRRKREWDTMNMKVYRIVLLGRAGRCDSLIESRNCPASWNVNRN
jgi:hypothetical protein